jgi:hypothetical protein
MARVLAFVTSILFVIVVFSTGCGDEKKLPPDDFGTGRHGATVDGGDDLICLLNNCTDDFECKDCTGNRTACSKADRMCVACGQQAGGRNCPQGYSCTKYGDCVPEGTTCAEDPMGAPTVTCTTNAQCAACGPHYRVCDPGTKKCGGCTQQDTSNCQKTEFCKDSKCVPKCPNSCGSDSDCDQCGVAPRSARSCVRGRCMQCNPENPSSCPDGLSCTAHGTCQRTCGRDGRTAAGPRCLDDNDCGGCVREKKCDVPINGGYGKCAVPAPGCSELAKGLFTLPEPYDKVTNLCSTDQDCHGVGVDYNVGKELREFTGVPFIGDANISYGMNVCASVDIIGSRSCGVCVPCRKDADCKPLDVEQLGGQLAGSLGRAAIAKTMDTVFGTSDHKVHFYCENVAGNYGVCLPCGNPLARCGEDPPPATGPCNHDICTKGEKLGMQCNGCVAAVCEKDPYCCTIGWDAECVKKTEDVCPMFPSCFGQSCKYKSDGWYCSETVEAGTSNRGLGTYKCSGGALQQGNVCPKATRSPPDSISSKYCHPIGNDWKRTAQLATDAEPQCFDAPAPVPN